MTQKITIAAIVIVVLLLCWLCGPTHSANLMNGFIDWVRTFGAHTSMHGGS